MIRFIYDDELIELANVEPDLTVLDWLRLHKRRTGTKEGCGSGDCGACTVVTVSVVDQASGQQRLQHESINSCITFIGALHGKQLLTVESLASNETLHPVQQAMVDEHGSQCGFCTPGFIMSMFALFQQDEPEDELRGRIDQALGGNLCRCTGYRPIKTATMKALDWRAEHKQSPVYQLADQQVNQPVNLQADKQALIDRLNGLLNGVADANGFHQPVSIESLAELYQHNPQMRLLAGGTDLALEVTQQMDTLPLIIHVGRVPELRVVDVTPDYLVLGAAVTLSECLSILSDKIPAARDMLLRFGSDQVRNQATIGGNLGSASPIGDLPPLLLALDAQLTLQRGDTVRTVNLQDYYTGYRQTCLQAGEFVRHVQIPLPCASSIVAVHKISKRTDDDISSVCMALHLPQSNGKTREARLAFGGMAATPVRATGAEQALNDSAFDEQAVLAAQNQLASELQPISDARASANYRLQVAQNLLQRVLLDVNA